MGETRRDALRVGFDRAIKLQFHEARVSSDAGLFPYRDLNDAAHLTESGASHLFGFRTGCNNAPNVVSFYNQRGICEQWIKEGRHAIHWARLSCHGFGANQVHRQLKPGQLPAQAGAAPARQTLGIDHTA